MSDDLDKKLEEFGSYLLNNMHQMEFHSKNIAEHIMERTVRLLEAGATPEQIKEAYKDYISEWNPDRTYG
jgi:hypothetical protein